MLALIIIRVRPRLCILGAVPLFVLWRVVMGGIWLLLFSVVRIFTSTLSSVEVALTIIIGVSRDCQQRIDQRSEQRFWGG